MPGRGRRGTGGEWFHLRVDVTREQVDYRDNGFVDLSVWIQKEIIR